MTGRADPALIATCWTTAGAAGPTFGDEISPVPFAKRIDFVASAGWAGIGFAHADLMAAREEFGWDNLAALIAGAGLDIVEVEFLDGWWEKGAAKDESDRVRDNLFAAAKALGARHVKVGAGIVDHALPVRELAPALADLAASASEAGVRLALEPAPFGHLPTIAAGVELVKTVGSPAVGLMIDTWHTYRSGMSYTELWSTVPIDLVAGIEIDDGAHRRAGSHFEDTIHRRLLCGEGDFDTRSFVAHAKEAGYGGPWGVEIISDAHRALPAAEGIRRAFDTALACFD